MLCLKHTKKKQQQEKIDVFCVLCIKYSYQRLMLMPSQHAEKISDCVLGKARFPDLSTESPLSGKEEVAVIYRNHWSCMEICITCVPGSMASYTFIFKGLKPTWEIIIMEEGGERERKKYMSICI